MNCGTCGFNEADHTGPLCEKIHSAITVAVLHGTAVKTPGPSAIRGAWKAIVNLELLGGLQQQRIPFMLLTAVGSTRLLTRPWLVELYKEARETHSERDIRLELLPIWAEHQRDPVVAWWRANWP